MRAINQVVLPLNLGYKIPDNDPVILLSELCDELDYKKICKKYLRKWRKHSPKTLFKIIVYGYMRKLFSSRAIEEACRRDICFMWLLNDKPTPDHSTITRFMDDKLSSEIEPPGFLVVCELYCSRKDGKTMLDKLNMAERREKFLNIFYYVNSQQEMNYLSFFGYV